MEAKTLERPAGGQRSVAGMVLALVLAIALTIVTSAVVSGQQQSGVSADDLGDALSGLDQEEATAEPAQPVSQGEATAGSAPSSGSANLSAAPTSPPAIAQGLVYLNGQDVVFQVREVEFDPPATAAPVSGNSRIIFQRAGASVVRNDVTGKRTRLEVNEAYYAAAGDPYTIMADGDGHSVAWIFEVANSDEVGEGAFYLSPDIGGVAEGTYDLEMMHTLLDAGDTTGFASEGGPFLIVVLSGQVVVNYGDGTATLMSGDGRFVQQNASIEAEGEGQAVFVVVAIGASVSDDSAAAPAPPPSNAGAGEAGADQPSSNVEASDLGGLDPDGDEDNDYMTNADEIAVGLDPYDDDTDADRILDGQEWTEFGTDPFDPDSDDDGLVDGAEYDTTGTKPSVWDTDGDGWGDGDEWDAGTDPLDPGSHP